MLVGVVCSIHPFTNIDAPRIDGDGGDFSDTFYIGIFEMKITVL